MTHATQFTFLFYILLKILVFLLSAVNSYAGYQKGHNQ